MLQLHTIILTHQSIWLCERAGRCLILLEREARLSEALQTSSQSPRCLRPWNHTTGDSRWIWAYLKTESPLTILEIKTLSKDILHLSNCSITALWLTWNSAFLSIMSSSLSCMPIRQFGHVTWEEGKRRVSLQMEGADSAHGSGPSRQSVKRFLKWLLGLGLAPIQLF